MYAFEVWYGVGEEFSESHNHHVLNARLVKCKVRIKGYPRVVGMIDTEDIAELRKKMLLESC